MTTFFANFDTPTEFVEYINKRRKIVKDDWLYYSGIVAAKQIEYKGWKAEHIQRYKVDGIDHATSSTHGDTVKGWLAALLKPFEQKDT